jgi:hypothetical protein
MPVEAGNTFDDVGSEDCAETALHVAHVMQPIGFAAGGAADIIAATAEAEVPPVALETLAHAAGVAEVTGKGAEGLGALTAYGTCEAAEGLHSIFSDPAPETHEPDSPALDPATHPDLGSNDGHGEGGIMGFLNSINPFHSDEASPDNHPGILETLTGSGASDSDSNQHSGLFGIFGGSDSPETPSGEHTGIWDQPILPEVSTALWGTDSSGGHEDSGWFGSGVGHEDTSYSPPTHDFASDNSASSSHDGGSFGGGDS